MPTTKYRVYTTQTVRDHTVHEAVEFQTQKEAKAYRATKVASGVVVSKPMPFVNGKPVRPAKAGK